MYISLGVQNHCGLDFMVVTLLHGNALLSEKTRINICLIHSWLTLFYVLCYSSVSFPSLFLPFFFCDRFQICLSLQSPYCKSVFPQFLSLLLLSSPQSFLLIYLVIPLFPALINASSFFFLSKSYKATSYSVISNVHYSLRVSKLQLIVF